MSVKSLSVGLLDLVPAKDTAAIMSGQLLVR